MDLKFYKCMHCGNIAIKPFDAGVPLVLSLIHISEPTRH